MSSESHSTFFKQSIWMVAATVASGVFMVLVHTVAKKMDPMDQVVRPHYTEFFTLLRILVLLGIPTIGLQTIFAQQSAAAVSETQHRQLNSAIRAVMGASFVIWLIMAAVVFGMQDFILGWLKIKNVAALWVTMFVVLTSLWIPIFRGLLQGQQNFLGLGWIAILDGVGRFIAVAVIVLLLGGKSAGAMTGALIGQLGGVVVGIWLARSFLAGGTEKFNWSPWLKRVIPLTCGVGVLIFIQTADVVFVKGTFSEDQSALYMPANMIGFALVQFAGPITAVMFPKIVRSVARSEKTNALQLTFLTTALVGGVAAIGCTLLPALPIRIIYANDPRFLESAPIVPWFAWSMAFMILASVLINNLLAREKFAIVPWLLILSVGYVAALYFQKEHMLAMETMDALKRVVRTLGAFSVLLLGVSLIFSWRTVSATNQK